MRKGMKMKRIMVILAGAAALAGCGWTPGLRDRAEIVTEPSPCGVKRFDVYFAENEARLTNAAPQAIGLRSEARRVGQVCRSGWSPYHQKKKKV